MFSNAKLLKSFWVEAMRTIVNLFNISPSTVFDGDVPKRVWTRKDISYKHLRVFICRAYVFIPKYEISKLNDKPRNAFF